MSIGCFPEKEGSRIDMTLVFGGHGGKAFQIVLSFSGAGWELA